MGDTAVMFNHFHKYPTVYNKWTTKTEGNVNDLSVVNGSVFQVRSFIHH